MKRLLTILLFLPLISCNDWLDIDPENSVTLTNFFQNENDLESLHTSMLARLQTVCMGKQPYYYMSIDADEQKQSIKGFRELDVAIHTTQTIGNSTLKSTWSNHYAVISLADLMIDNEYRFQNIPAERAAFWLKQAHFVKALTYFRIAQIWGDAPISPNSESLVALAKSPAVDVLKYAAKEAKIALDLPAHDNMQNATGRPITSKQYASRGSVNTLLAQIYAWIGGLTQEKTYWEQAEYYASQVIDEFAGDYELEDMEGLIKNVFGKARNSKETIFCIDNDLLDDAHTYDTHFTGDLPGQEMINYPHINASPQSLSNDNAQQYNRIKVSTVEKIYPDENDLRRKEFWYNLGKVEITVNEESVPSPYAFINKWRDYHYQTNSEMLEGGASVPVATDCDFVIWRLADVILLRAECRTRLNKTEAKNDLDRIRERAGLGAYSGSTEAEALRKEIFNERRRELFGEGQYYFDIVRNGYYREMLYG
ncbi:MAG: RagB/SusD family nutrient uptake outer membrane protein, partial [Odoribacter sp.]|nr:RagB/SusD family nutrient uptake outer membrane protein [Odoribacter sp.]